MTIAFVVPADLSRPTGGNRYDQHLAAALDELGSPVEFRPVAGAWPVGSVADRVALGQALTGGPDPRPGPVLVDGLLACGAPEEVDDAVARGVRVHILVHMPLSLDPGLTADLASSRNRLEGRALRAAARVIATSAWTAADLGERHAIADVVVAQPGSWPAGLAHGSEPPLLLHLAAVTPVKNQLTVVEALARLTDQPWQATLAGALDADPAYAAMVARRIVELGLGDRVQLTGAVTGPALDQLWAGADLLLLPSRAETWGMAVTEALARGVPAVVGRGTGAEESLGRTADGELPGSVVDPESPAELAAVIRHLLGPDRDRAAGAALNRRATLTTWTRTAEIVRKALA